jgi:transposase
MKPYSMDLRQRVVAACEAGTASTKEIAVRFNVSLAWVKRLRQRQRETGSIAPKPHAGGAGPKFKGEDLEKLKQAVEANSDATLEELLEVTQVPASIMAVHRALERLGFRRKKSPSTPASKSVQMSKLAAKTGATRRRR